MLYGVTMQEKGITKLIELNVAELEKTSVSYTHLDVYKRQRL